MSAHPSTAANASPLHHIPHRTKRLPPLRVGIGGPVGSGKTTLLEMLCKAMRARYDLVVVTNDIYTKEDLAPHVGANLDVMRADTERMRPNRPYAMTNLKTLDGLDAVVQFIETKGLLQAG